MNSLQGSIIYSTLLLILAAGTISKEENTTTKYYMPYQPVDPPSQIEILRFSRRLLIRVFGTSNQYYLNKATEQHKFQDVIPSTVPFPCSKLGTRSSVRPKSVHEIRPGDIDVIGALGDSLTAGNGITATDAMGIAVENRGLTATIGGQGTWRKYLTVPNILKEFNPNLVGYSLGDSITADRVSQFNVAEGGAISMHTPYMAKLLVQRIIRDPRVNVEQDWKFISVLIGANDFCSEICSYDNPEDILEKHRRDIYSVLRILRDHLPRTIVSFYPTPHMKVLRKYNHKPRHCFFTHAFECNCMYGAPYQKYLKLYDEIMTKWQIMQFEIATDPEFDLDDFTVVFQPFVIGYKNPGDLGPKRVTDYTHTSYDCFHFSQRGTSHVVNLMWNNIVEPVGQKTIDSNITKLLQQFKCPTEEQPYIFTNRNSGVKNLTQFRQTFIDLIKEK